LQFAAQGGRVGKDRRAKVLDNPLTRLTVEFDVAAARKERKTGL